ncbi:Asr1405/Asl0597 family protein [Cyanothece sp. BG0011]|uniref:Asr1405/Asl0597 family protein n=1 Tax=Cyanothece sp. BG0011 TaxID=2082950 RepID=UPI0018E59C39|nr:Asr1405/Asl0597 family protein [Cyanothece sp. BG0011]
MNSNNFPLESSQFVTVNGGDRWFVAKRLQELQIPCSYSTNQPLQVQLSTPTDVIQLWSVLNLGDDKQEVLLVASVPLTKENWIPLAEGEIQAIANGRVLEVVKVK